jgi:hypothetical protein
MRPVPGHIKRPPYADSGKLPPVASKPEVHDAQVGVHTCLRGRVGMWAGHCHMQHLFHARLQLQSAVTARWR